MRKLLLVALAGFFWKRLRGRFTSRGTVTAPRAR